MFGTGNYLALLAYVPGSGSSLLGIYYVKQSPPRRVLRRYIGGSRKGGASSPWVVGSLALAGVDTCKTLIMVERWGQLLVVLYRGRDRACAVARVEYRA
jgi:hypothetical protein